MGKITSRGRRLVPASGCAGEAAQPPRHEHPRFSANSRRATRSGIHTMSRNAKSRYSARNLIVFLFFLGLLILLATRAVYLQVFNSNYLQEQGNARHMRLVKDNAHRGMILDHNGAPLAVSTPVDSV